MRNMYHTKMQIKTKQNDKNKPQQIKIFKQNIKQEGMVNGAKYILTINSDRNGRKLIIFFSQ